MSRLETFRGTWIQPSCPRLRGYPRLDRRARSNPKSWIPGCAGHDGSTDVVHAETILRPHGHHRLAGRRSEEPRAGFTLIETLVALVVVALVMAVTQRGFVTARLGLERAQSTLAAEAVARSIVETELDLLAPAPGVRRGQTDGLAWMVTTEPIVLPLQPGPPPPTTNRPPAQNGPANPAQNRGTGGGDTANDQQQQRQQEDREASKWRPMRVTVAVANGLGRPFTVETLHLVKVE